MSFLKGAAAINYHGVLDFVFNTPTQRKEKSTRRWRLRRDRAKCFIPELLPMLEHRDESKRVLAAQSILLLLERGK